MLQNVITYNYDADKGGLMGWSFSHLSTALQCEQKYKYVIDKVPSGAPESGDMHFGTAMHAAINATLEGDDPYHVFNAYMESLKGTDVKFGRYKGEDLSQIGNEILRKFEKIHKKNYVIKLAEKRLFAPYKNLDFEGTPDFFGTYKGVNTLVDFKTSGYRYDKTKIHVGWQLYLYAYLCEANDLGKVDQVQYCVFNKSDASIQIITKELDKNVMYQMLESMAASARKVGLDGNYPMNYNSCIMGSMKCDYFEKCHGKVTDVED